MAPKVLMVAEKPSIALAIASALSGGRMSTRRGSTEVHEFDGMFLGFPVHYKVTSVIGHVFSVDFPARFQDWNSTNPLDLFDAPIVKSESTPKVDFISPNWASYSFLAYLIALSLNLRHLSQEARGCGHLVLWLDCDREGENICFEVIECTGFQSTAGKKVHRARFSSVTEKDILKAMNSLVEPNRNEAQAVDARQEIDLKVGVAFTRFQTSYSMENMETLIQESSRRTDVQKLCKRGRVPESYWYIRKASVKRSPHRSQHSEPSEGETANRVLQVASSALGFGPQLAMQLAERLYTQGFISYPRTESTAYPASFDYKGTLGALARNPVWGDYVQQLLSDGYHKPRSGTDAGDHPPITPMSSATENILGHDAWKLYQYICQHFLGTLSPDCKYTRIKIEFESGGESFNCVGQHVLVKGFTSIMPWLAVTEINIPQFTEGQKIDISRIEVDEGSTQPPDYLSESELISLMEENGIGTDASIPVHINNICERNYVQIALVAKGQADHSLVVEHVIEQFKRKFIYFVKQIENMDALFEAEFSPLSDSGRVLSKCGKCLRYMKHIPTQPSRLYCGTCEEIYYTPPKGTIKLYKELTCPLDNFELLIFSMPGPEGKSFPFCPYCYNNPPFEGIDNLFGASKSSGSVKLGKGAGMPCFLCPHPTCQHSMISQGVCACPECDGTLVLDPVSAPRWRLYCNMCNCLVSLPEGAHRISTTKDHCPECDSTIIEVDFNKKTTPLKDGATLHIGCILCDELLYSLVEMKHGKSFSRHARHRGRGRGRGRRGHSGRGRGSKKQQDPRMSFRDF
ncbi:UNVERIFIED_CONTAM: DNA topoisomerase 3-beta [Sesamum radiatum]|uniref:DNA topoisomerase n=1 Tax=Sesamum radiatum TaxID=300843 RepID=A0AAW2QFS2_SESRA